MENTANLRAILFSTFLFLMVLSGVGSGIETWTKEPGIRIDVGGPYDSFRAYLSDTVILPDGSYRMYYAGNDGSGKLRILSAVSSDGLTWTKESGIRVDYGGTCGPYYEDTVFHPEVIELSDGTYRMYYECTDNAGHEYIKSAYSSDGLTWVKDSGYRLAPDYSCPGGPDSGQAHGPSVIRLPDGRYRMYYYGSPVGSSAYQIFSAISNDGLTFTKECQVLIDNSGSYHQQVHTPDVIQLPDGSYKMYYADSDSPESHITSAISSDGLTWTKEGGIRVDHGGTYDAKTAYAPDVVPLPDGRYRMYYSGACCGPHDYEEYRVLSAISSVIAPPGPDTTPPDTIITSYPPNPDNSLSGTFEFISSETGSSFECKLDSNVWSVCTSPYSYTGLSEGSHTFEVKATDLANNTDPTPASYTWIINTTLPAPTYSIWVNDISNSYPVTVASDNVVIIALQLACNFEPYDYHAPSESLKYLFINSINWLSDVPSPRVAYYSTPPTPFDYKDEAGIKLVLNNYGVSPGYISSYTILSNLGELSTTYDVLIIDMVSEISDDDVVIIKNYLDLGGKLLLGIINPPYDISPLLNYLGISIDYNATTNDAVVVGPVPQSPYTITGTITTARSDHYFYKINISAPPDSDSDGIPDEADACPTTPGKAEYQGCPVGDENLVELHVIDRVKTFCGGAGSCKLPIEGAEVRVFDRNDSDFQALFTKNPKGTEYQDVFDSDIGRVGTCTTDSSGKCIAGEETTGDYLIIVKYTDTETSKIIYTGKLKSPDDFEDTDGDGTGDLASKDFQIIKVINKDGSIDFKAGSKTVITGSILEVIYPEYVIWENNETLYPFIFTSDSDWEVDVCVYVPEGYKVVDGECTQVFMSNETKDVIFTVVEMSSPEPNFKATIKTKHKGKIKKVDIDVPGKRTKKYLEAMEKAKKHKKGTPPVAKMLGLIVATILPIVLQKKK